MWDKLCIPGQHSEQHNKEGQYQKYRMSAVIHMMHGHAPGGL
jgi:hypothetical protein